MRFHNFKKKASSSSNIIMWIGIIIALIIVIYGVANRLNPQHYVYEKIEFDLNSLSKKINDASNAYYYEVKYNPIVERGVLEVHEDKICINDSIYLCKEVLNELDEENISLDNITYIVISKKENDDETKIGYE